MSFKKGDTVIYTASGKGAANLTDGHEYIVRADTYGRWVPIIGDDNKDCHVNNKCLTFKSAGKLPNPHGQRITTPQGTFAAQYQHDPYEVQAVDEENSYDERKANARVTSTGLFDKGDVLVYLDGTPTLTTLTVVYCTATAVCFEETYSMPFNPIEFRRMSNDE